MVQNLIYNSFPPKMLDMTVISCYSIHKPVCSATGLCITSVLKEYAMTNNIDKIMQRTRRYWYVDGLPEVAAGCLLLLAGLLLYLGNVGFMPPDSPLRTSLLRGQET